MSMESDAKEASILQLLDSYPSFRATDAFIEALLAAVEPYSVDAVKQACARFLAGEVDGHNNAYVVNAAELASQARMLDGVLKRYRRGDDGLIVYKIGEQPPPGYEPLGPIKIEIGGRNVDVSALSFKDKMTALKTGQLPKPEADTIEANIQPKLRSM